MSEHNGNRPVTELEQENAELHREINALCDDLDIAESEARMARMLLRDVRWERHNGGAQFTAQLADESRMRQACFDIHHQQPSGARIH